jgi:hypothetical protein
MDNDKLQKGIDLKDKIEQLEKRLNIWEKSERFTSINIVFINGYNGRNTENMDSEFVNFEVLKALTIDSIKKELTQLKAEYENL